MECSTLANRSLQPLGQVTSPDPAIRRIAAERLLQREGGPRGQAVRRHGSRGPGRVVGRHPTHEVLEFSVRSGGQPALEADDVDIEGMVEGRSHGGLHGRPLRGRRRPFRHHAKLDPGHAVLDQLKLPDGRDLRMWTRRADNPRASVIRDLEAVAGRSGPDRRKIRSASASRFPSRSVPATSRRGCVKHRAGERKIAG